MTAVAATTAQPIPDARVATVKDVRLQTASSQTDQTETYIVELDLGAMGVQEVALPYIRAENARSLRGKQVIALMDCSGRSTNTLLAQRCRDEWLPQLVETPQEAGALFKITRFSRRVRSNLPPDCLRSRL